VSEAPVFDAEFRARLRDLVRWRRDVRRFRSTPVPPPLLESLINLAAHAPSVGLSQPWRFVKVEAPTRREAVMACFESANERAKAGYEGERRALYASLKLAGLREAPAHLAVYSDEQTTTGGGLGLQTMPEMRRYSVVAAVQTLWLAARAEGLGVGWVSIIDPAEIARILDVPPAWRLVAYLCIGWPKEEHLDPELERHRWENRRPTRELILLR